MFWRVGFFDGCFKFVDQSKYSQKSRNICHCWVGIHNIFNEIQIILVFYLCRSPQFCALCVRVFDRNNVRTVKFDDFIQCCVMLKTLTDAFRKHDTQQRGVININYEQVSFSWNISFFHSFIFCNSLIIYKNIFQNLLKTKPFYENNFCLMKHFLYQDKL